jgi:hypothetical protein
VLIISVVIMRAYVSVLWVLIISCYNECLRECIISVVIVSAYVSVF